MVKQRCGTCRFFQDASLAGSGWCHHPQRRTTSDLLIMVRRNELACRDEWTHSLWESGVFGEAASDVSGVRPARRLAPATELEIAALVKTQGVVAELQDVVLDEARIVSEPAFRLPPRPPVGEALEETVPRHSILDLDTRSAIKRARETYRERARMLAKAAAEAEAQADPPQADADGDDGPAAEPPGLVAPAERDLTGWSGANGGWVNAVPEAGAGDEASPLEVEGQAQPGDAREIEREAQSLVGGLDRDGRRADLDGPERRVEPDRDPEAVSYWGDADEGAGLPDPKASEPGETAAVPVSLETAVGLSDGWGEDEPWEERPSDDPRLAGRNAESLPVSFNVLPLARRIETPWSVATGRGGSRTAIDDASMVDDRSDEESSWSTTAEFEPGVDRSPTAGQDEDRVAWPGNDDQPSPFAAAEEPAWSTLGHPLLEGVEGFQGAVVPDESVVADGEPGSAPDSSAGGIRVPLAVVAAGVPRLCRTCRSYRPAEGGERGWCANRWAFTHRRLVEADDPEPCESSIGSWWLAADDVCLAAADISTHGQPTPHLDRWLPRHRERPAERRQS